MRHPVIRSSSSVPRPRFCLIPKTLFKFKARLAYDNARSASGRTGMVSALPNCNIMNDDKEL